MATIPMSTLSLPDGNTYEIVDKTARNEVVKRDRVVNLLDNSDFRNPVNQRNAASGSYSWNYHIDRWMANGTINISSAGLAVAPGGKLAQRMVKGSVPENCTAFVMSTNNELLSATINRSNADRDELVYTNNTNTLVWAALYEGEYTAETLPPYVPKGYAAELIECQRYFERKFVHLYSINQPTMFYDIAFFKKRLNSPTISFEEDTHSDNLTVSMEVWANNTGDSVGGKMGAVSNYATNIAYWYGYVNIHADL